MGTGEIPHEPSGFDGRGYCVSRWRRGLDLRLRRYRRVFTWSELALFKVSDILTIWWNRPVMRRTRALRSFSRTIPMEALSLEAGEYRFRYAVGGRDISFRLRAGTSDVDVFQQVMVEDAYGELVRLFPQRNQPLRILDAGANIGLTTLYLKAHFPSCHILALEPEPGNFRQLQRCVAENGLEGVTLLNQGIWTGDTDLAARDGFRDRRAWSFALEESVWDNGSPPIPVRSLETILSQAGWNGLDLLKLDVEGAEEKLLRDPGFMEILSERVGLLCMEVHEEAIPLVEARDALETLGLRSVAAGENLLAWREPREP